MRGIRLPSDGTASRGDDTGSLSKAPREAPFPSLTLSALLTLLIDNFPLFRRSRHSNTLWLRGPSSSVSRAETASFDSLSARMTSFQLFNTRSAFRICCNRHPYYVSQELTVNWLLDSGKPSIRYRPNLSLLVQQTNRRGWGGATTQRFGWGVYRTSWFKVGCGPCWKT